MSSYRSPKINLVLDYHKILLELQLFLKLILNNFYDSPYFLLSLVDFIPIFGLVLFDKTLQIESLCFKIIMLYL